MHRTGRCAERGARGGRAGIFALGWIVGFLLLGYAALRALELAPRSPEPVRVLGDEPAETPDLGAWRARVAAEGVSVLARLLPLHDEPVLEEFRARTLRERYALPPGRPWRLYVTLEEAPAGGALASGSIVVLSARVPGALEPFARVARDPAGGDPVHALLAAPPGPLELGRARPMVLWGDLPMQGAELELELAGANSMPGQADEPLVVRATLARDGDARGPRWYAAQGEPGGKERSLEAEVARLERELQVERARRAEREEDLLEFGRMLSGLPVAKELGLAPPVEPEPPPSPEALAQLEAADAARARAEEIGRALGVLMRLEGLRGLDLLEPGTLLPGPPAAIGPVVFRCFDERGALTGSLGAERLRLEASQSARTLTIVLEEGFESRGGAREPFLNGVRRITLNEVDPAPWLQDCPELFSADEPAAAEDDGRWRLFDVRRELNRLLALDTRLGWYRLHSLGGVRGSVLLDVQLEELTQEGRLERRFFADQLALRLEDASVVLELEGGAIVRGGEKQPFRDGRHHLVLPGVALAPWRAALLPGLSPPPAPSAEKTAEKAPEPDER